MTFTYDGRISGVKVRVNSFTPLQLGGWEDQSFLTSTLRDIETWFALHNLPVDLITIDIG